MNMNKSVRRAFLQLLVCFFLLAAFAFAQNGGELRFCLRSEPKTFDPALVDDDASVAIRYLTGGVLVRANRKTQDLEPELRNRGACRKTASRSHSSCGMDFISDGSPFSAEDVAFTMQRLMDPRCTLQPETRSALEAARSAQDHRPDQIAITFPAPLAGLEHLFDQVAIMSRTLQERGAVLGPFMCGIQGGVERAAQAQPQLLEERRCGRRLPYLDSVRLDIQPNRDVEMLRFKRGELDLINSVDSDYFDAWPPVHRNWCTMPALRSITNSCGSTSGQRSIPEYKRAWFRSVNFRRAISQAVNRDDLSRIVFNGTPSCRRPGFARE